MGFSVCLAFVVVGAEYGIVQGSEGGEEHRAFELAVAAAWGMFAVDRGARGLRCRSEVGIRGEVGGGREAGCVADGDQQCGSGPDADAGQRRQDLGKRVVLQQGCDLVFQRPSMFVDGAERAGQRGDDDVEGAGARDHDGLLIERLEDLVDHPGGHPRRPGADHLNESAASGFAQRAAGDP